MEFKTISELQILKYARYELWNRIAHEEEILKINPNNSIAQARLSKYVSQSLEIGNRLCDLEVI